MMRIKKKHRWWAAAVVLLALILVLALRGRKGPDEGEAMTATARRGDIVASVSGTGVLQAASTVEVKSNIGGQIVQLAVDEGDIVKAGQLIARIDPSDSRTALEQAQADLTSAGSKVAQARSNRELSARRNESAVAAAEDAVEAARQRLAQAQQQAEVQPRLTSASIAQARSSLEAARASFNQTKNALIPQKTASARAAFDQAQASSTQAQSNLVRQRALLEKGFISQGQVEDAEQQAKVAAAQLDSARSKLETIKDETAEDLRAAQVKVQQAEAALDTAQANGIQDSIKSQEAAAARASLKQAEANLASARAGRQEDAVRAQEMVQAEAQTVRSRAAVSNAVTQLGYTTIVAPSDGVVVKKYVEQGSIVMAGRASSSGSGEGVALVEIADISRMQVLVNVDETDMGRISVGQAVDVTVDAFPDDSFKGRVAKVAPKAVVEQNVTSIPVTVDVLSADPRLKPGLNAGCDFIIQRKQDVLLLPAAAVRETRRGMVVTLLRDGKPTLRPVKTGVEGLEDIEITDGLREGDVVSLSSISAVPETGNNDSGRSNGSGPGGRNGSSGSRRSRGGPPPGMF